ncbi:hypothetical protein C2845_PM01G46070 [Panicum miliaceum]|uniref:Uncharacterized protein n=1 Tax=Panicum miliaceum TaxID=4540 RepID=A0A3L6TEL7_PANMI|nr:hypothetical protein C2845_PM01G46070 [Panicum miliaceum]
MPLKRSRWGRGRAPAASLRPYGAERRGVVADPRGGEVDQHGVRAELDKHFSSTSLTRFKPQPDANNPKLVGGAGLQLRNKEVYLEYSTLTSLSGWHAQSFYIGNHKPGLPERDNAPPKRQDCRLEELSEEDSYDIPELMKRNQAVKDKGVTRESVAYSFLERRIQPLQQPVHLGFEYRGTSDPSRMARDVPSNEEIMHRVTRLFTGVDSEPYMTKIGTEENPDPPRWRESEEDSGRSPASGQSLPATTEPAPTSPRIIAAPRGLAVPKVLHLKKASRKKETPGSVNSGVAQVGKSTSSLPKEPVAASTATPLAAEDAPGALRGEDLNRPGAALGTEAPGNIPEQATEEVAQTVQVTDATTLGQQEVQESSWARLQQEVEEGEVPPPSVELFELFQLQWGHEEVGIGNGL